MNLESLGFNDWYRDHIKTAEQSEQTPARVMAVDRGAFLVRHEHGESSAELAGKLRFSAESSFDLPCVGDWVCIENASPGHAMIQSVLPRMTYLRRKTPGKTVDFQMIATNLDAVFIVQSCHFDFNIPRLERYLVVVNESGIKPIIILSKTDLITPEELENFIEEIRNAGISAQLLPISNTTGNGLAEFHDLLLPGKTYCLVGSSGVGKSTVVNRVLGEDMIPTKEVSESGEGVHTTSRRQLLLLENGAMLIDTPGMRELGMLGTSEGVEANFSDIQDLSQMCRFSNCTHAQEPGCAVLAAVHDNELSKVRYQTYIKLQKETDFHDLSYLDKRKKDKSFGKFIKTAKKHKKH